MAAIEFWTGGAGLPTHFVPRAIQAERDGFDGITIVDSQNLSGDPYIALAIAARETTSIRLGTGVTNPVTRHAAVAAAAIATVQVESGGRAFLGIGRGDSALAHIGFAPASVETFETYLTTLQGYLSGDDVAFDDHGDVDRLGLAHRPPASRIRWLRHAAYEKVPVDVAATGPKVIAAAARHAERLSFAVGADPVRLRWAKEVAREARSEAGLDPSGISMGAYLCVVPHPDAEVARRLGEGGVSLFTRFSSMHGSVVGPATAEQRATFQAVHDAYDMTRHSRAGSPQAQQIPQDFAERFAVLGPSEHCVARLVELAGLGLGHFHIVGPSAGADPAEASAAERRLVEEVLPAVREALQ